MPTAADYLAITPSAARAQWHSIVVRPWAAEGRRQVAFTPVETLLCLAASLLVDHRRYGGSTAHRAEEPVPSLIAAGESQTTEFKSSARWNPHTSQYEDATTSEPDLVARGIDIFHFLLGVLAGRLSSVHRTPCHPCRELLVSTSSTRPASLSPVVVRWSRGPTSGPAQPVRQPVRRRSGGHGRSDWQRRGGRRRCSIAPPSLRSGAGRRGQRVPQESSDRLQLFLAVLNPCGGGPSAAIAGGETARNPSAAPAVCRTTFGRLGGSVHEAADGR